jgi:hypothetical protein
MLGQSRTVVDHIEMGAPWLHRIAEQVMARCSTDCIRSKRTGYRHRSPTSGKGGS